MTDEPMRDGTLPKWFGLIVLASAVLVLVPVGRRLAVPFEDDYHGGLIAWFHLMSENMERDGFRETRCLPPLNPEPAVQPNFRYYVTHPVGDVILRAGLMRLFGHDEWVSRIQGLFGMAGAAFFLWVALRRRLSPAAAAAAAIVFLAVPLGQRTAHLSMHHPMTLFFSMAALATFEWVRRAPILLGAATFAALLCAMSFDWPGYFAAGTIWVLAITDRELDRRPRRAFVFGLPLLVAFSIGSFWFHVDVVGGVNLLQALRGARAHPGQDLGVSESLARVFGHLRDGVTPPLLWVMIATPLTLVVRRCASGLRLRAAALAGFGVANVAVFFEKAPHEDFWTCYLLPFAGLSTAFAIDTIAHLIPLRTRRSVEVVLALAILVAAPTFAFMRPLDTEAARRGADTKTLALTFKNLLPADGRTILVTNYAAVEMKVFLAYARVNLHLVPRVDEPTFRALPDVMPPLFRHVHGATTLFYFDLGSVPEDERAAASAFIASAGFPLHGGVPNLYDITSLAWSR